jgi:uncharacterized protein (UPF0332 family)
MMDLKQAKEENLIKDLPKEENINDLSEKEMQEAEYDLEKAKNSLIKEKDTKWSTTKAYYSVFHAARAFMYQFRLKEIKHEGVIVFLEDRVKVGKLRSEFLNIFKALKSNRENADYENMFSEEKAKKSIEMAEEFLKEIKKALK